MTECAGEFIGRLAGGLAHFHHILDAGLHLPAHCRLLYCAVVHGLLHPVDGVLERSDYLSDVLGT